MVAGADITLTNSETGRDRRATTDDTGHYTIPNVKAAVYSLTAEKPGFQKQVVERLILEVQLIRTVDVDLSVGAVTDQVSVVSSAAALQAMTPRSARCSRPRSSTNSR